MEGLARVASDRNGYHRRGEAVVPGHGQQPPAPVLARDAQHREELSGAGALDVAATGIAIVLTVLGFTSAIACATPSIRASSDVRGRQRLPAPQLGTGPPASIRFSRA